MTSVLGEQGEGGGVDLIAVNLDAELLDLLARRAPMPVGDPVLAMLAALAADVDEGLDDLLVASEDDPLARAAAAGTVVPDLPAPRRGHGMRVTTVAIVVGATLSIGGVAAAVTGDPLAPVKGIVTAMGGHGAELHPGKAQAFGAAKQARSQLRHGDVAAAQASLADMKAQLLRDDLSAGDRRSIEARIDSLERQIERAVAALGAEPGHATGSDNGGNDGTGTAGPNGQATGATKGKAAGGKGEKPADGTATGDTPSATRSAEPDGGQGGSGGSGGAGDEDDSDEASDSTTGSGKSGRSGKPSPSSTSVTSDDPADDTATADPSHVSETTGTSGSGLSTDGSGVGADKGARGAAAAG